MRKSRKIGIILVLALVFCMIAAVGVWADDPSAIETAVSTALTTTQSDAMSMIATVLPFALAVFGAFVVIKIGIRAFKVVTGR